MQLLEVSLRDTAPTDQAIVEEVEMHSGQYFVLKNTITILIKPVVASLMVVLTITVGKNSTFVSHIQF